MRKLIVKLGQVKTVILVTIFSCITSVLITLVFLLSFFDEVQNITSHLIVSILVPLILTPIISSVMFGMFFRLSELEIQMREAATYDSLTGLLNRRTFMEQGSYLFHLARREGFGLSVLLLDLDHFKSINDEFGHAGGDRVLESFGKVARQVSRKSDICGRLGGEEFAFILPNTSSEQAWTFADRLHKAVRKTIIMYDGSAIRFTLSIGIAAFAEGEVENIDRSLNLADKAMYQAKKNGKDQSVIFNGRLEAG